MVSIWYFIAIGFIILYNVLLSGIMFGGSQNNQTAIISLVIFIPNILLAIIFFIYIVNH